jgi:hypothetical protein
MEGNLQMSLKYGGNTMDKGQLSSAIVNEFQSGEIRNTYFPMMCQGGITDYSEMVHSIGLNYITQIGRTLENVVTISECPVIQIKKLQREIRSDSIWFDRNSFKPILISEFERYEDTRAKRIKVREKAENLLIAYHQLNKDVEIILYVTWGVGLVVPQDMETIKQLFIDGFQFKGNWLPGIDSKSTSLLLFHAIASNERGSLVFNKWVRIH